METRNISQILKILLKNFTIHPTITDLAKELGMSRVGTWKVLKRLEAEKMIVLLPVGTGKTSAYSIRLNWDNSLVEKKLSLVLSEEAVRNQRWISNLEELKEKVEFLIIYGSIVHSPKEANDIDLLGVANKSKFVCIDETIRNIQKTQIKKIHPINLTTTELKKELEKPNKAFIDAIKKGIILFGQEKFIKFMKDL